MTFEELYDNNWKLVELIVNNMSRYSVALKINREDVLQDAWLFLFERFKYYDNRILAVSNWVSYILEKSFFYDALGKYSKQYYQNDLPSHFLEGDIEDKNAFAPDAKIVVSNLLECAINENNRENLFACKYGLFGTKPMTTCDLEDEFGETLFNVSRVGRKGARIAWVVGQDKEKVKRLVTNGTWPRY